MPYKKFDRDLLAMKKLAERKNKINIEVSKVSVTNKPAGLSAEGRKLVEMTASRIRLARQKGSAVMLTFGAHTIKNGMAPVLQALMKKGWVTHLATNGAGIIHDWEFAYQGWSSEDVKENVRLGQFGIWHETGFYINLALIAGAYEDLGYGESVGKLISTEGIHIPSLEKLYSEVKELAESDPGKSAAAADFAVTIGKYGISPGFMAVPHPFRQYSVQAKAFDLKVPFTGHPMIGHDIIYTHPVNSGAAIGRTALNDFLCFTESVKNIDHGVYISVGSAVMSPMIFEKALSMSQNIMIQQKKHIDNHFILVVDLAASDWDWERYGEPSMDNPAYYLRYCKTFSRMGGKMHYLTADNRDFLLALYQELTGNEHT
jgi:hypothetical protein